MPYGFICWEVDCFYDAEVLGVLACQIFIRTEEQGGGNRVRGGEVVCGGNTGDMREGWDVRYISADQSGQGTGFHDVQDAWVKIDENFLDR
jgi:hypothetical protein